MANEARYCYLVVREVPYEGNHVRAIFSERSDADRLQQKLQEENDMAGSWDYVVEKWELK